MIKGLSKKGCPYFEILNDEPILFESLKEEENHGMRLEKNNDTL